MFNKRCLIRCIVLSIAILSGVAVYMWMSPVALTFDLDVDSDNDYRFRWPKRSADEDQVEEEQPGKVLLVNDDDTDDDGILDFADGFNRDGIPGDEDDVTPGERFIPVLLEIDPGIDLSRSTLQIEYDASDPAAVSLTGGAGDSRVTPAPGHLRLWTKPGDQPRNKNAINDPQRGDFVSANVEFGPDYLQALGFSETNRKVTLYLEGVRKSDIGSNRTIRATFCTKGTWGWTRCISDAVLATVAKVRFIDSGGGEVEWSTSLSHPYPVVEIGRNPDLDPFIKADLTINEAAATAIVHVYGKVNCSLADIIEDSAADIQQVTITVENVNTDGGFTNYVVPVTNVSTASLADHAPAPARGPPGPRPFIGVFDHVIEVQLTTGDVPVAVKARNVIGNEGFDSFSIHVDTVDIAIDPNTGDLMVVGVSPEHISGVTNHDSTSEELYNPIWVYIDDVSIDEGNAHDRTAEFFGTRFALIYKDGQARIDRAFVQVGRPFSVPGLNAPNVLNVENDPDPATVYYFGMPAGTLEWSDTAE